MTFHGYQPKLNLVGKTWQKQTISNRFHTEWNGLYSFGNKNSKNSSAFLDIQKTFNDLASPINQLNVWMDNN